MEDTRNPQAYPTLFYNQTTGEPNGHDAGMTLRDYFAAKAMQGLTATGEVKKFNKEDLLADAECYYAIADAMLKQRAL